MEQKRATINLNEFEVAKITTIELRNNLYHVLVQRNQYSYFMRFTEKELSKLMYFMDECKLKDRLQEAGNVCFGWKGWKKSN